MQNENSNVKAATAGPGRTMPYGAARHRDAPCRAVMPDPVRMNL